QNANCPVRSRTPARGKRKSAPAGERFSFSACKGIQNSTGHTAGCFNAAGTVLHHHGKCIGSLLGVAESHHPAVGTFSLPHFTGTGFGAHVPTGGEQPIAVV